MGLIRKRWTPEEADEWTREDVMAWVLSPLSYLLLSVGSALSLFLIPSGFLLLAAGISITFFLFYTIDPKLKAISSEYEKKQKGYLERLERITRWEEE